MQAKRKGLDQQRLVEVRKVSPGSPRIRLRSPWDRWRPAGGRIVRYPHSSCVTRSVRQSTPWTCPGENRRRGAGGPRGFPTQHEWRRSSSPRIGKVCSLGAFGVVLYRSPFLSSRHRSVPDRSFPSARPPGTAGAPPAVFLFFWSANGRVSGQPRRTDRRAGRVDPSRQRSSPAVDEDR
jgi:hypothetical protein